MKTTKKLLAVLLAALMLLTVMPLAFAAGYDWTLSGETGTLTITGSGAMSAFSSASDAPWYESRAQVKEVIFADGITNVPDRAFVNCSALESVTLPNSITKIGAYAFEGCSSLAAVTLPEGVTAIGAYAFRNCTALASINLPENLEIINSGTFLACASLGNVTIPEKVTKIDSYAFQNCASITEITLPKAVASVGKSAFANCTALKKITILNDKIEIAGYGTFPPATPADSEEEPVTIYSFHMSSADSHATVNGYRFVIIHDEDHPEKEDPQDVQEVIERTKETSFFQKLMAFFGKDPNELSLLDKIKDKLGLTPKENEDEGAEGEADTITITGPGADIGRFIMRTPLKKFIASMRQTLKEILAALKIDSFADLNL